MKFPIYPTIFFCLSALISSAQTGSVALKNASNVQLSTHTSISDAYASIPSTLTAGYIIEIGSTYDGSTETYPITFVAKTGASTTNTITLRPASTVTAVTIQTTIATAGSGVMRFDDADYIVIDGRPGGTGTTGVLTFNNLSTGANGNTIAFINGACNNLIQYCYINNSTTSSAGRGVLLSTSASNTSGNSDNVFRNCVLTGGRYIFNSNGTAANSNTRNLIKGCTFRNASFASVWAQTGTAKLTVDSSEFFCTTPTGTGLYFALVFDSQKDSAIIKNNQFYDIQDASTGVLRYIHVRSIAASSANFIDIRNNFFAMITGNSSLVDIGFIELEGNSANGRVVHNSFRMAGTQTATGTSGNVSSSALHISSTSSLSAYEIKNNLFVNERTGGTGVSHVALNISSLNPSLTIDYNTYNAGLDLIRYGTTTYTSLSAYQSAIPGGEPNANTTPVQYVSGNNLHLSCSVSFTNSLLQAPAYPGTTRDIDNQLRGSTTVFRGADEVIGLSPNVTVNSGTICTGNSFTITTGGNAASYSLSTGSTAINPTITTTYTATGTSTNGCQAVAVGTLLVNQLPTVTVNSGVVCQGASFTLSASGASNYTYSSGSVVTPVANSSYTVTGVDANGCVNQAISQVTVNSLPTLSVNSGTICAGDTFTLVPSGAVNYTYSGGGDAVNPITSTVYTITGADAANCASSITSTVNVNALPLVLATSGSICAGSSFTIVPSGAVNYSFAPAGPVVSPASNSNYTVVGEDANGCKNSATVSLEVNPLPTVTVNSGEICKGATFTLAPSGAVNYTYSSGTAIVNPLINTVYTVTGADQNNCTGTAQSTVTVNLPPSVNLNGPALPICVNSATVSVNGIPAGGTYNGPGLTGSIFNPSTTGNFTISYVYTDTNGCSDTAYTTIIVDACTGFAERSEALQFSAYPNPGAGLYTLQFDTELEKSIKVSDLSGKVILQITTSENSLNLDLSAFANGMYLVNVKQGTDQHTVKLIKH